MSNVPALPFYGTFITHLPRQKDSVKARSLKLNLSQQYSTGNVLFKLEEFEVALVVVSILYKGI